MKTGAIAVEKGTPGKAPFPSSSLRKRAWKARWYYVFMIPGILYFLIFKIAPMWGVLMSFQDYQPSLGMLKSDWVGFKHFERLFQSVDFWKLFRNTFLLAFYNLAIYFPITIVLALILNEVRHETYKRFVQTLVYIPHFLSWVVVAGITYLLMGSEGLINQAGQLIGQGRIDFLYSTDWFRPIIMLQIIWKDGGWGTIILLAALAGVNMSLYEAAKIDGASRMRMMWHITLPSIRSVIIILLILRLGNFMDLGFEQIYLMLNPLNREVGEVFDTYVFRVGIQQGQFSYSAAVGLFKSVIGLVLVWLANKLAKKFGEEGIY
ncbi:ABC transporter permease [Paenibacillus daejeonensis]|uniref:ABC transporter permease n=1 Tax=Paenibacillus daejeonensis TaxID=135193 RepID=UPI00039ECD99|nr:ABC transporter permease subunit [Paenibacillus daejeonensis]